jgi:hypothetical protein
VSGRHADLLSGQGRREAQEETAAAGSSGLQYDAFTDRYTYVWKTLKGWANSCRQLNVKLDDGSDHLASFQFR